MKTELPRQIRAEDGRAAELEIENTNLRELLKRTRAVLRTALHDDSADLDRPARKRVLTLRIDEISAALEAPHAAQRASDASAAAGSAEIR